MQKTRAWPGIQYGHWFKLAWYGAVNMVCYVGMARSIGWHGGAATLWQYSGFECVKRRQVRASNQPNRHHGGSTIHYKAQSWGKVRMDTAHKSPCSAQIARLTHLSYSCCIILLSTVFAWAKSIYCKAASCDKCGHANKFEPSWNNLHICARKIWIY